MVIAMASACWLLMLTLAPVGADDEAQAAVRAALAKGAYPWYDAAADGPKAVNPPRVPEPPPQAQDATSEISLGGGGFGGTLMFVVMAAALLAGAAYLVWTWRHHFGGLEVPARSPRAPGSASRVAALPAGLSVATDDPWSEARRRRDQGDLSGAIVCLFVHLLLTLERQGTIRLVPGRTGRQLVRAIGPEDLRALVEPTLRLFEAAYYGHHQPSPEAFAVAWNRAETLRSRLLGEAAR